MDRKVWIITGASKGLGYAFTKAALADGNIVIAAARHTNTLEGLRAKYHEQIYPIRLDVTDRENTFRVVSEVAAKYGHIDVLVSNAGHLHKSVFEDTAEEDMRREFDVNFFGAVNVIQAVLPYMRRQGSGRIVQTTSVAGLIAFGYGSTYHASKYALEGMLDNLSRELRGTGISVTAFEPGSFKTNLMNVSTVGETTEGYQEAFDKFLENSEAGDALGESPVDAAEMLMKVVKAEKPPRHILIGKGLIAMMEKEYGRKLEEWKAWDWDKREDA